MQKRHCRIVSVLRDGAEVDLSHMLVRVATRVGVTALFGTFEFDVYVREPRQRIADVDGKVDIRMYDEATGGTEHRFTGLVDRVSHTARTSGVLVAVSGRSYAATIVENLVSRHHHSYSSGLSKVIAAICEPLGVKTIVPQEEPASGTVDFGNISAFDAVKHIASHEGLAMRVRPDGETIEFTKGSVQGPRKEPDHVVQFQSIRGPITSASLRPLETRLDDWQ